MNAIHRKVLTKSIVYLTENLMVDEVFNRLLEDDILNSDLCDRIKAKGAVSRIRELVKILPFRGPKAFSSLIKATNETHQSHVSSFLYAQQELVEKEEEQNEKIRRWLKEKLIVCNPKQQGTLLIDLHRYIVTNCKDIPEDREFTIHNTAQIVQTILSSAVPSEINDVDIVENQKISVQIKGIIKTTPTAHPKGQPATDDNALYASTKHMREWSMDEVCQWLKHIGRDSTVLKVFKLEKILGKVLLTIQNKDLREMKVLKIGDRVMIIQERDEYLQNYQEVPADHLPDDPTSNLPEQTVQPESKLSEPADGVDCARKTTSSSAMTDGQSLTRCSIKSFGTAVRSATSCSGNNSANDFDHEGSRRTKATQKRATPSPQSSPMVLRKFDTKQDNKVKYTKGTIELHEIKCRPDEFLLVPTHRFVQKDLSTKEGVLHFERETVKFICACMNERTNGTIHFGIVPDSTSSPAYFEIVGTPLLKNNFEEILAQSLETCFFEDQLNSVQKCVRQPVIIEVIPKEETARYVIEVDVVASYRWCEDGSFYARLPTKTPSKFEDMALFVMRNGNPKSICSSEQKEFIRLQYNLAETRRMQEECAKFQALRISLEDIKKYDQQPYFNFRCTLRIIVAFIVCMCLLALFGVYTHFADLVHFL